MTVGDEPEVYSTAEGLAPIHSYAAVEVHDKFERDEASRHSDFEDLAEEQVPRGRPNVSLWRCALLEVLG